jgi:hypothetical protein
MPVGPISVSPDLALTEATVTFADGKMYTECADSTSGNVPTPSKPHFPRMALTRAKARALSDARNSDLGSVDKRSAEKEYPWKAANAE